MGEDTLKRGEGALTYELSYQDVIEILRIVDEVPEGHELRLEIGGDFKLSVRKEGKRAAPAVHPPAGDGRERGRAATVEPGGAGVAADRDSATGAEARPPRPGRGGEAPTLVRENVVEVKAPLVGTFYRAPGPGAAPFVEVGSPVEAEDAVGIIEVTPQRPQEIEGDHQHSM